MVKTTLWFETAAMVQGWLTARARIVARYRLTLERRLSA